jgi:hypothetical protein
MALIRIEGPGKATRGRDEWESIKITRGNSTYILKLTWRASLLARSKPQRWNTTKTQQDASKAMSKTSNDQNQINGQFKGSRTFHQTLGVCDREPITRVQQALEKFEPFDPTTYEQSRESTCKNSHLSGNTKLESWPEEIRDKRRSASHGRSQEPMGRRARQHEGHRELEILARQEKWNQQSMRKLGRWCGLEQKWSRGSLDREKQRGKDRATEHSAWTTSSGAREIKSMKKIGTRNGNKKSCAEILAAHKPSRVVAEAITRDRTGTLAQRELDEEKQAAWKQLGQCW